GVVAVELDERLARRLARRVQRDGLLERRDGLLALAAPLQLAHALPQPGASRAQRGRVGRLRVYLRQRRQRARQARLEPLLVGQLVAQLAQRGERVLVGLVLGQRLLEQRGGLLGVPALGDEQRGVAPARRALLRILDEIDEQRRRA